ncbi:MAG TPA: prenyltransferase [Dehalococcoidia bacterium]|nr:prenyltransferase [Dehalococcoidia bacterium]
MHEKALSDLAGHSHVVVSWVGDDGYPVQTPARFKVDEEKGIVRIATTGLALPTDRRVNVMGSHIRPQPGTGYDERRYTELWGTLRRDGDEMVLAPERAWGWDEKETPFFEYAERSNRRARAYMRALAEERGAAVRPRLSPVWTALLATRLPFLTGTIVPVLVGIAVAGRQGYFDPWPAILTIIGGAAVHIGLNVANDVFDEMSGADEENVNPTQFSGGSRVIQRGLVSLRRMGLIAMASYAVAIAIGLYLVVTRESTELLVIGVLGVLISVFYTAPPLRLVHHGLGEIAVAIGFGPVMVLGAYVVQAQKLTAEPFVASVPIAILIALILYVNEIPDRRSDASVGKRTLPVRFSRETVTTGFLVAASAAFATVFVAAVLGVIPRPAIISLLGIPLALSVYRGIQQYYSSPYELMATMGKNVQLHLVVGMLMFTGYLAAITIDGLFEDAPDLLT